MIGPFNSLYLYLISQSENVNRGSYDSAVVCASTAENASKVHPHSIIDWDGKTDKYKVWCDKEYVTVEFIGIAGDNVKENSVVCSSYNE